MEEPIKIDDAFVQQLQLALQMQGFTGLDIPTVERIAITHDQVKENGNNFSLRHAEKIQTHLNQKYPPKPQQ